MIDPTTGKMIRVGAPPKIQQIDFNKFRPRKWEYQNYFNQFKSDKGKKRVKIEHQKEKKSYNHKKMHPQPNSKRTIIAELGPIITIKAPKKKVETFFNKNNLKLFQDKKRVKNRINNQESEITPYRKHIKSSMFNDYKITQIATLPCSIRRESKFIKDDKNKDNVIREKKRNASYFKDKLTNDFYSNIICLPNSLTSNDKKQNKENKKLLRGKSCINYTINKKEINGNYIKKNKTGNNNFKGKIKRIELNKKIRPLSTNTSESNLGNMNSKNKLIKRYKNEESKTTYDLMKPSSILNTKIILRSKYKKED
jgi:hypothetical protein